MPQSSPKAYRFGEFKLDMESGYLLRGEDRIDLEGHLTKMPKEILVFMLKNTGTKVDRLFTRDELLDKVWEKPVVMTPSAFDKHISTIRTVLGDAESQEIIETVPRQGFRFKLAVTIVYEEVEPPLPEPTVEITGPEAGELPEAAIGEQLNETERVPANGKTTTDESLERLERTADIENPNIPLGGTDSERELDVRVKEISSTADGSVAPSSFIIEDTFESWIKGSGRGTVLMLTYCLIATAVISISVLMISRDASGVTAKSAASFAQLVLILIMVFHFRHSYEEMGLRQKAECEEKTFRQAGFKNGDHYDKSRLGIIDDLEQYRKYWLLLLISWIPLYVAYSSEYFGGLWVASAHSLETLFNGFNTLLILFCFSVLNKDFGGAESRKLTGPASITLPLVAIVAILGLAAIINNPAAKDLLQNGSSLFIGVLAGIAMALFVGRLQSKFLAPRPWLLWFLYSYTAIQPLALYLEKHPRWAIGLLGYALFLKCLLYIYVYWLFASGNLLFYFAQVKFAYGDVGKRRIAFRQLLKK